MAFLMHFVLSDGPPHDVGDGGGDQAEMDFDLQSKHMAETRSQCWGANPRTYKHKIRNFKKQGHAVVKFGRKEEHNV